MEDYFKYIDNFKKDEGRPSICIFGNKTAAKSIVTIGIPTYKRTSTLKEALDSALTQKYSGVYEVIVLDNNPERNDETEVFMKDYCDTPLLSYYKNSDNLGMSGNWNRVFLLSQSKWVVLLHDDDILAPTFLQEIVNVADKYSADVVNSEFFRWKESKDSRPQFNKFEHKKYPVVLSTLSANHFLHFAGMPSGIMYKRDLYIKEGGANQDYFPSQDYVLHSLLSYKYKFLIYQKPLTIYRISINESSNIKTIKIYIPLDYSIRKFIGNILQKPSFYTEWISQLYSRAKLNDIHLDSIVMPELNNRTFKKLNRIERLVFEVFKRYNKFFYSRVNRIGKE